uniref:Uncharacterized protein n=1 Tax=Anguilla anguilla TaxID=7936 RepID=A0A0E9UZH0_ANGAN
MSIADFVCVFSVLYFIHKRVN